MATIEFKLPDIGEGVAEGEITSWKVKPGDLVKEDQVMVEVMTDKATVEIGAPVTGKILELLAKEGQSVPVGTVIVTLQTGADVKSAAPTAHGAPPPAAGKPASASASAPAPTSALRAAAPAPAPAARPAAPARAPSQTPAPAPQPAPSRPAPRPAPAPAPAAAAASAAAAPSSASGDESEEINFALPDIGEGVAEGEVTRWLVKAGDKVKEDQPIVEVMTDKATVEIGSPVDGEVLELLVKEGQTVPVGSILLVLGARTGAGAAPAPSHAAPAQAAPAQAAPAHAATTQAASAPRMVTSTARASAASGDGGLTFEDDGGSAVALADTGLPPRADGSRRVRAAPATRRFAREAGVEIGRVNGSGPGGRITMDDVRAAAAGGAQRAASRAPAAPAPQASQAAPQAAPARPSVQPAVSAPASSVPAPAPAARPAPVAAAASAAPRAPVAAPKVAAQAGDERVPLRGLRKRIAAQMRLAKQTAAHFTYVEEIDVTELVKLRAAAKARAEASGVHLTYMPFLIKAVVPALREFPLLNSALDEEAQELVMHGAINIGVAVDTPAGLIVPVVRDADRKSMLELAREMAELADRARAGKTRPDDVGHGTFTITNAGNIGGLLATPIINVPEVAIMGVHAIRKRPWVVDDEIVIRDIMLLSLSLDHRVVDGAEGARFMNRIKQLLENPGLMLFEEL